MLVLVGLGLRDVRDIPLRGLEEAKSADKVYVEFYTSKFFSTSDEISEVIGKPVSVLSRSDLEEESRKLIEEARSAKIVVLVPGDPTVATTHIALKLEAMRMGVECKIIHASSIIGAVCGATGLQSYRFGKSATVSWVRSRAPVDVIKANRSIDAHTLLLLDLHPEMSIRDAVEILREVDESVLDYYAVGLARLGDDDIVRCDKLEKLADFDFGDTPHCIVVLARTLHIVEYECLEAFASAPEELRELVR